MARTGNSFSPFVPPDFLVIPAKAGIHPPYPQAMVGTMQRPCVYILASKPNGTLYIGVTNDVIRRVHEHRTDMVPGFTSRFGVHDLVYLEFHETMPDAIRREKQMKKWNRAWKQQLISKENPDWRDLFDDLFR